MDADEVVVLLVVELPTAVVEALVVAELEALAVVEAVPPEDPYSGGPGMG